MAKSLILKNRLKRKSRLYAIERYVLCMRSGERPFLFSKMVVELIYSNDNV